MGEARQAGRITLKQVQTHFECVCGHNIVDDEYMRVRWKDLPKLGVVRREDKATGAWFLFQHIKGEHCYCYDE